MAAPVIQFKRGLLANLPSLQAGEPGFTTDSYDFYIGLDGQLSENKFFGSHRYWTKETTTVGSALNLVEGTSSGSNYISLSAPGNISENVNFIFPGTQGVSGSVLSNDGSGNLSWSSGISSPQFSGIATFTDTTDNDLGDPDTGAVQIDGGLGIEKNVTIGGNLNVQGYAEFVGVVTFQGGVINLGDDSSDNINVVGEFVSNLVPDNNNTYDIGITTQKWRDAYFSGIGSFESGAYIDSVIIGIGATNEISTISGNLILDSETSIVTVQNNLEVSGIATVSGTLDAQTNVVLGSSSGDTVTVNGTTTFVETVVGTISTATRATTVDTVQSTTNAAHYLTFVTDDNVSATAESFYTSAGVTYNPSTSNLTISNDLIVNGDITTEQTDINIVNSASTVTIANSADALYLGSTTGIATIANETITFPNATTVNVDGADPTLASISTGTLTLFDSNITSVNAFGDAVNVSIGSTVGVVTSRGDLHVEGDVRINGGDILSSDGNTNITLTSNTLTTFAGDIQVGGNDINASDGNTNITLTSNTLTTFAGDIQVGGNDINASDGNTNITMTSNTLTEIKGDLQVTGNDIKSSTGDTVLTLNIATASFASDLTVNGNLYVAGSTTQVNTSSMTVEDRTIELGLVDGSAPSSATTWDLGVLFNYYTTSAKKSGVFWEHGDARFKFGSDISDGGGTDNDSPQVTVTTFAPIEIGALWVNDCAGQSQVISCTGSTRYLENITIDAGTF